MKKPIYFAGIFLGFISAMSWMNLPALSGEGFADYAQTVLLMSSVGMVAMLIEFEVVPPMDQHFNNYIDGFKHSHAWLFLVGAIHAIASGLVAFSALWLWFEINDAGTPRTDFGLTAFLFIVPISFTITHILLLIRWRPKGGES